MGGAVCMMTPSHLPQRCSAGAGAAAFEGTSPIQIQISRNDVIVIVWLCSAHLAVGVKGEISPYE